MVAEVSLHLPTGGACLITFGVHHDGGPIGHRSVRLLDPITPEPLPEGHPHADRTEADVARVLGPWRIVTRAEAIAALRAEGYLLGTSRAPGHVLYADQADQTAWYAAGRGYTRCAFAVRDRLVPGPIVQRLAPHLTPTGEQRAEMTGTFHLAGSPSAENLDQSPRAGQPILVEDGVAFWLADHRGPLPAHAPGASRRTTVLWEVLLDEQNRPDWRWTGQPDVSASDTAAQHAGDEYEGAYTAWDALLAAATGADAGAGARR
jgi:hypothetical protein